MQYPGPDETPDCSGSAVNAPITGTGAASGVVTVLEAGNSLAFTTPMLAHTSGELALCYKFQAESDYAYFDDIRLVVRVPVHCHTALQTEAQHSRLCGGAGCRSGASVVGLQEAGVTTTLVSWAKPRTLP